MAQAKVNAVNDKNTKVENVVSPVNERIEAFKKLVEVSDAKCGEYKGNDLLILKASSRFPFQFGISKAKVIVENIELIKAWVDMHGSSGLSK